VPRRVQDAILHPVDIPAFYERTGLAQVTLAKALGVSVQTVWRWSKDGKVPLLVAYALHGLETAVAARRAQQDVQ